MPRKIWSDQEARCLINHVHENRGANGSYVTNREEAIQAAKQILDDRFPNDLKSEKQIQRKLDSIDGKWTSKGMNLFMSGHRALKREHTRNLGFQGAEDAQETVQEEQPGSTAPSAKRKRNLGFQDAGDTQETAQEGHPGSSAPAAKRRKNAGFQDGEDTQETVQEGQPGSSAPSAKRKRDLSRDPLAGSSPIVESDEGSERISKRPKTDPNPEFDPSGSNTETGRIDLPQSLGVTRASTPRATTPPSTTGGDEDDSLARAQAAFIEAEFGEESNIQITCTKSEQILLENIRLYLKDRPRSTTVSLAGSKVADLGEELVEDIQLAVRTLLEDTDTSAGKAANLGRSLSIEASDPLIDLCCTMYGVKTPDELLEVLSVSSVDAQLDMTAFLRAIVAVAIYQWVLLGQHKPKPGDQSEMSELASVYADEISSLAPELHKEALRRSKHTLINDKFKVDPYVPHLAHRLIDALTSFLKENLINPDAKAVATWNASLREIFGKSLKLAWQTSLLDAKLDYTWPKYDSRTQAKLMRPDEPTAKGVIKTVQAVFFAGIRRKESTLIKEVDREVPFLKAVVRVKYGEPAESSGG